MEEVKNRFVTIKNHINGAPKESDFEIRTETINYYTESKQLVVVKNMYVSVDPYQLNRMKSHSSSQAAINFSAAITLGQVIDTYGVGRVMASGRPDFTKDDLVVGLLTWGEYTIVEEGRLLNKLDPMGLPLPYHGEKVFVSAASGSVGSLVGQYAKIFGCHVVGCAGTQEKVNLLKQKLGFDDAFNYKDETDLKSTLKRYFPEGIDIYFDNVGGEMLEAAVANMNTFGRVAVCGVISEYTGGGRISAPDMLTVVYNRITIQGFLAADYLKCYGDFISTTAEHLRTGKMQALCDISHGVESVPSAFIGLFRGDNIGKKINRIDRAPNESDFIISEVKISLNHDKNVVIVKNLYVSIDPYQINRMKTHSCSQQVLPNTAAILPGQAIDAGGVGRVVKSTHPDFKTGDLVTGLLHWGEYSVIEGGSSGLTAYGGFFEICKPKKGEKVFVSAASGSVGMLVGQYAKLFGCYVVGSAGTKQKVDLLKEKLGFDDAFNYKEETEINSTLQRYFPNGIDIYFDNVGGEMLEATIENMNIFGRVAACGAISEYTDNMKKAKPDMIAVIYKRIKIEGFLSVDFMDIHEDFITTTVHHLQTGKLQAIEDISYGVESIPTAFVDLFRGNNIGKTVVQITKE
ncbi:hypothetical protein ACJIZ3_024425 [Penstemon smallii]|uniref:Enoyl reductase (ER) domain-containing protein n=1 Tax=Penstemon smallii TaxID=265156 RepID=A0ABD3TRS0_9LAMI